MRWRNTSENYGVIAKGLHWLMAVFFLGAYFWIYYRHWFTERGEPENWTALQMHMSIGMSLGILILLRILWRLMNPQPKPEPGTRLEHLAAKIGHYVLYAVMIIMPVTGYMGVGVAVDYFFLFDIPTFKERGVLEIFAGEGVDYKEFGERVHGVHHMLGQWVVWVLILGHAGAALYHHFGKGDRTLKRMTTG